MDAAAARRLFRAFYPDVEADDPADYLGANRSAVDALACGWLYWPRLIEVHGAVFLAVNGNDEDYVTERLAAMDRSHSAPGFPSTGHPNLPTPRNTCRLVTDPLSNEKASPGRNKSQLSQVGRRGKWALELVSSFTARNWWSWVLLPSKPTRQAAR